MKQFDIDYSIYELHPKRSLNSVSGMSPRLGALLRLRFNDYGYGYAVCHPWPELGDEPLSKQLGLLKQSRFTPITTNSLNFARIDARARHDKKALCSFDKAPTNHWTSNALLEQKDVLNLKSNGFCQVKFKFGLDLHAEKSYIKKNHSFFKDNKFSLRLDFNEKLSNEQACQFLNDIENELDIIDFIEDISRFDNVVWAQIRSKFSVRLGLDRCENKEKQIDAFMQTIANLQSGQDNNYNNNDNSKSSDNNNNKDCSFDVIVIKPAVDIHSPFFQKWKRNSIVKVVDSIPHPIVNLPDNSSRNLDFKYSVLFTSYMTHPLEQICAQYFAAQFYALQSKEFITIENCGLLTHPLFEPTAYTSCLEIKDTKLFVPKDYGFGFTDLLSAEDWKSIDKY